MECMLKCVTDHLRNVTKGRGNCNMPVVNYCVHFGGCLTGSRTRDSLNVQQGRSFVNAFRRGCHGEQSIVHNKCSGCTPKCIEHKNGVLFKKFVSPCLGEAEVLKSFGVNISK